MNIMNEFRRSGAFYKSESYRYWICDVDLLKERQIEELHHFDLSIIDQWGAETTAKVYPWERRTLSTSTLNVGTVITFWVDSCCAVKSNFGVILFTIWFMSLSNCYCPETLEDRLKYMWLCVCVCVCVCVQNIFNLVKVYTCCCKIFKGLTFSGHTVCRPAEWLGCWTCDQQVAGSKPSRPAVGCNPGQVV